jgi:penicillin-binding protein 1A
MVSAYSTLAARGQYRQPLFVTRVTDKNGNVLASFATTETQRVMSDQTVGHLINMLRDAVDRGTGQPVRAQFGVRADVAGKTGTTQKNTDGWFILMHPKLVAGSWVGFNDARVTMRSNYWGEGAHNALLLVGDFFQRALDARLIDGASRFPYERPHDSIWDPVLDTAKEWLGGLFKDWWLGDRTNPAPLPPRRDLEREAPRDRFDDAQEQQRLERQTEKERLMERLREKQAQYERERLQKDGYRNPQEK